MSIMHGISHTIQLYNAEAAFGCCVFGQTNVKTDSGQAKCPNA